MLRGCFEELHFEKLCLPSKKRLRSGFRFRLRQIFVSAARTSSLDLLKIDKLSHSE